VCNCVDVGLRNTTCKHIHAVVSTFKPAIMCTPSSQVLHDSVSSEINVAVCSDDKCAQDCEDVDVSEQVVAVTIREVELDKTTTILLNLADLIRSDKVLPVCCGVGMLHLVDLAGSENLKRSGVTGDRLMTLTAAY